MTELATINSHPNEREIVVTLCQPLEPSSKSPAPDGSVADAIPVDKLMSNRVLSRLASLRFDAYNGSMRLSKGQYGAAVGIITLGPTLFTLAGTNVVTLRAQAADPESRKHLRIAQVVGSITLIGVGMTVGLIVDDGNKVPVYAGVGTAAAMVLLYEYALRKPKGPVAGDASTPGMTFVEVK